MFNNDLQDVVCSYLTVNTFCLTFHSQSRSTTRPFLRCCRLTAPPLAPTWGLVQDHRRGNMAWLFWTVTHQTPPPRNLHPCSTAAKSPSCLIRAIMPCIPLRVSPSILTVVPVTAACLTLPPITWWVWGPALATTQGPFSPPLISPVEVPRNKPCTKGGKY